MNAIPYVLGTLFILFVGFQLWTLISARKMRGQRVPEFDSSVEISPTSGRRVLYFYSPNCGPCRAITPMMDQLVQEFGKVTKIDISQDLGLAKRFSVKATPTTLLVENETIADVILGAPKEGRLREFMG